MLNINSALMPAICQKPASINAKIRIFSQLIAIKPDLAAFGLLS